MDEDSYDEFFRYPVSRLHSTVHLPAQCLDLVSSVCTESSYIRYRKFINSYVVNQSSYLSSKLSLY
jgi:hypothetical protein